MQAGANAFKPQQMMPAPAMNAANVQPFKMTGASFTPGPQKSFTAPMTAAPAPTTDMTAKANPFAGKPASNPFASSVTKEFIPSSAKPFTPATVA